MTIYPSIQIGFEVDDADVEALLEALNLATSAPGLLPWLYTEAVAVLRQRAAARFDSEGDAASGGWLPLADLTNELRLFDGFPPEHPINVRTGRLHDFVTSAPGDISGTLDSLFLTWPTASADPLTEDKLRVAQKGNPGGSPGGLRNPNVPARPVVAVDETDLELLMTSLGDWIPAFTMSHLAKLP